VNVACIGEIRPRQKWEGSTIDLRETVCEEVEWIQLAQGSEHLWSVRCIETPDFHKSSGIS